MENLPIEIISWTDFAKIDMRIGTIISAEVFAEAKNPSYKLVIDFGEYGKRKSSAQITKLYQIEELIGRQVIAVINFPPKQIANIMSECLVLGGIGNDNEIALIQPDRILINGIRVG